MAELKAKVQLVLRAVNLPNKDVFSKSDPFVVVSLKSPPKSDSDPGNWIEIARTSTIKDNNNPQWQDLINVDFHFEQVQYLKFEIYDRDSSSEDLRKHDFLGYYETTLAAIMGSRGCAVSEFLKRRGGKPMKKAKVTIIGEQQSETRDILEFQFRAEKLERKNMFGLGKSDPFYTILQKQSNGTFAPVFKGEVLKSNLNPKWQIRKVPLQQICNGDLEREIRIDVQDYESGGKHQMIGSFVTTVRNLIDKNGFNLVNVKKSKQSSGKFYVAGCKVNKRDAFLSYIEGGCEIKLSVAVDFTGSNGHPLDPGSLHSVSGGFSRDMSYTELNQYQRAILSVTRVLESYDSDGMIPFFGFGGSVGGVVSHCFPLGPSEEVQGIQGMMNAYSDTIQKVAQGQISLSGPTYFKHVINKAVKDAGEATQDNQTYSILLILTDGIINDMAATIDEIVAASRKPMSIVIVGVGGADFSNMTHLDNDDAPALQDARGRKATRDIVQFVPFSKFMNNAALLAEETLREIPRQMEDYFQQNDISANPKRPASPRVIQAEIVAVNTEDYGEEIPMGKVEEPSTGFYPDANI